MVLPNKRGVKQAGGGSILLFKKGKQKMKNGFRFISLLVMIACFALFTGSVFAQTSTTGSIEGTVTDQNGAPVPNVTVTVSGPTLQGTQSAQTMERADIRSSTCRRANTL